MKTKYFFYVVVILAVVAIRGAISFFSPKKSEVPAVVSTQQILNLTPPAILLTSKKNGTVPEDKFPCFGRVFAYVTFSADWHGEHVIEGDWVRPDGELQEKPELKIDFDKTSSKKIYFYLNSYEASSLEQVGTHKEKNPFDGAWHLIVRENGIVIAQSTFTVSCD